MKEQKKQGWFNAEKFNAKNYVLSSFILFLYNYAFKVMFKIDVFVVFKFVFSFLFDFHL